VGEAEATDGDGLEGAHLDAAVAAVTGTVQHGDAVPGQAGAAGQQGRLVGLDHQQVVRLFLGHQELGSLRVGLERVGGDDHAGEVEIGQQRPNAGDLLRGAADLVLGQHHAAGVVHRRQQVHRAATAGGGAGATQGLAVDRHRALPWPPRWAWPTLWLRSWRWRSASQAPTAAARALASSRPSVRRMVASAGTAQWSGASRQAPSAARTGWGASVAHSAMAANERAPASTAAAARARMAISGWRRPRALRGSGMVAR
jgi:hypothetical protein